jgi:hypothetical protein
MIKKVLIAAASVALSAPAFAASSGTIEGEVTVPYTCNVVTPSVQTLTAAGPDANGSASWSFDQNDDTTYTLSALTLLSTNANASLSGVIALGDDGTSVVSQTSEVSSTSADLDGNSASTDGTVFFQISEDVAPVLYAGDYDISTTLTCAQKVN